MNFILTDDFEIEDLGQQEIDVYDIEVDDNHNFFGNDILVHNSNYINLAPIVDKFYSNLSEAKITDALDKVCCKIESEAIDVAFQRIYEEFKCFKPKLVMKREAIASKAVFIAKKRYIMRVLDNEGIRYSEPKIKLTGVEAVRSSTPKVCKDKFKKAFELILTTDEKQVQKYIRDFEDEFNSLPIEEIAFPRSVSNVVKYVSRTPPGYITGTPINSRCAILFNKLVKENDLQIMPISDGDRMYFVYLKMPNPIKENAIGFSDSLPPEFKLHKFVDKSMQFSKTFLDPLQLVLNAIGWDAKPKAKLDNFFEWD